MRSTARSEKALLAKYNAKRHFDATPEPEGSRRLGTKSAGKAASKRESRALRFVVQKHAASHLHYDFRLEADGVLKSWAVPKGPSLNPADRRLAMQVEDHPLDYFDFEGVIPKGNYGAGEVVVWDWGTYALVDGEDAADAIQAGKLKIRMQGEKLTGVFTLVRMHGKNDNDRGWLLIKERDDAADETWTADAHAASVKTGRTLDDIRRDPEAKTWISNRTSKAEKGAVGTAAPTKHGGHAATGTKAAKATKTKAAKATKSKAAAHKASATKAHDGAGARMPKVTHPMLATLIDAAFDDPAWLFEIKWDGFRALCTIDAAGGVTLVSRNGKDFLPQFPSLAGLAASFEEVPILVDGEIVALDSEGRSSFQALQGRLGKDPPRVTFVAFDVLYAEGRDLRGEPLQARKAVLERLVKKRSRDVLYSAHVEGEGLRLFAAAEAQGLEGIIGKRRDSTYEERRTRDWVKIKAQQTQECVVVGYTDPGGARKDFGALILATYEEPGAHAKGESRTARELVYAGNVGTGFSRDSLHALMAKLSKLEVDRCPLAARPKTRTPAHWVKPKLVAQIRFTEWTTDGLMRHPAFLGLRDDKKPEECSRERPRASGSVQ